jgi:hypothetical protein
MSDFLKKSDVFTRLYSRIAVKKRLWWERFGVMLITFFALGTPLLMGFFAYLALSDTGIEWNVGDPLREGRLWIIYERRRPAGIGLVTHTAANTSQPNRQCARTNFTALMWTPNLKIDRDSSTCICYQTVNDNLRDTTDTCAP